MVRKRGVGRGAGGGGHGVADYFAVLGMHLVVEEASSSLPAVVKTLDVIDAGVSRNNHGGQVGEKAEDTPNKQSVETENGTSSIAVSGYNFDEGNDDTSSSLSELGPTRHMTPRNNKNLSKRPPRDSEASAAASAVDVDKSGNDGINNKINDGERHLHRLHEERFNREIVELVLITSTTNSDVDKRFTIMRDTNLSVIISRERNNAVRDQHQQRRRDTHILEKKIHLAYRRRRNHDHQQHKSDASDVYTPSVADVLIQYVKLRSSTIITSPTSEEEYDDTTNSSNANDTRINKQHYNTAPTSPSKSSASGGTNSVGDIGVGAARQLSFLARQGMEKLTSAVSYAIKEKQQQHQQQQQQQQQPVNVENRDRYGKRPEHFFPDNDVRGVAPQPQCRQGVVYPRQQHSSRDGTNSSCDNNVNDYGGGAILFQRAMHDLISLPDGYDEWIIPDFCKVVQLPIAGQQQWKTSQRRQQQQHHPPPRLVDRTHNSGAMTPSSVGMEAMYLSPMNVSISGCKHNASSPVLLSDSDQAPDPDYIPLLAPYHTIPQVSTISSNDTDDDMYIYIPILALRRQRIGEEERYHEDTCIVDIHLTYLNDNGLPPTMMADDEGDDGDDKIGIKREMTTTHASILTKSGWKPSSSFHILDVVANDKAPSSSRRQTPIILLRRNIPHGFCDVPLAPAKVLDRFPRKNYRNMPFPEEELPLFCYPRGGVCLVRDKLRNWTLPKSFGFVVKNERGDSIYVSCLTFLEPVTKRRMEQLDQLSMQRQETSLAHRAYCKKKKALDEHRRFGNDCLVGFDDNITFENKTICLLGRTPYWTGFRHFLTHLHLLSGTTSNIPLERNISHLLLSVPMPRPGGQCVIVPFSTIDAPMALVMPPLKDFPLVDLSYSRLFAALDVPTVVTIVLGFLCLERKVIMISTRQSLLLDCCELLKSLLFPFEMCAPYVPHLTQPFMSCLEFPGAIFVGIHDDGHIDGLARIVRSSIPEDSIIVELDSGEINCDTNRYETLKAAYQIIPNESRSALIKEVEALCQDAGIVPGQEPLDSGIDSACQVIDSTVPSSMEVFDKTNKNHHELLNERAVRDAFLRFFTSILAGYERFLVVPDADFLTSGNDWFDSSKFVAAAKPSRVPILRALVETQLFQSFVQRRTESSDLHCVLFDECLIEYHSTTVPYGRLSGQLNSQVGQEDTSGRRRIDYDLLVDQCATDPIFYPDDDDSSYLARFDMDKSVGYDNDTATQASSGYAETTISDTPSLDKDTPFAINSSGDIVTCPSTVHLPINARYVYYVDGHGSFPTAFDQNNFFPSEPDILETESSEAPAPILTRSDRERDESSRLFNMTVSRRGIQKQHRCLWQMAKYMGSQFFGAYISCIPTQISQSNLSVSDKSKILLRSLGVLRNLRNYRRIVGDEASYRALIVACGRCGSDRRTELTKLYGLMRVDGIFMNAVTLGCYTRAIAEGYSNINSINGSAKGGMQVFISSGSNKSKQNGIDLEILDSNLSILEESGVRWRSGGKAESQNTNESTQLEQNQPRTVSLNDTFDTTNTQRSHNTKRSWLPVSCSSSFPPHFQTTNAPDLNDIGLFALWSRATSCKACGYIPLDEEIQSGWDVITNKFDNSSAVACPRCGGRVKPLIGFREMSIVQLELEAAEKSCEELDVSGLTLETYPQELPPQLEPVMKGRWASAVIEKQGQESGFVTYLSPQKLRIMLEDLVLEYGEDALNRDSLRELSPEIFFNLWWYSARFSLPLPLSTSLPIEESSETTSDARESCHAFCAFASWDKSIALHGCRSAAKAIMAAQTLSVTSDRLLREKLLENPYTNIPLLSFFHLQNYAQSDWDHPDFSLVLVALVKACETRDLLPVVECVFQRNQHREVIKQMASSASLNNLSFESASTATFSLGTSTEASPRPLSTEMDCYRTILYLARYQCTTAFHAFFPTTIKPCKGNHFWCAHGAPMPIFDRAFREAADTYAKRNKIIVPIPEISGVALGFRSVFGHII